MRILIFALLASALFLQSALAANGPEEPRVYRVRQTAKLDQIPAGAKLVRWWIAIPDDAPHQQVLDFGVASAPGNWRVERDAERGNRFLYVEVENPKASELAATVEFTVRREPVFVAVDPARVGALTEAHRAAHAEFLRRDAPHMTVTPEIQRIADEVCGAETNAAIQASRLLEYVAANADHYSKDPSKPNCGVGDAENCLAQGGGCCTDLHSLFIALARAREIPARLQMGYRLQAKNAGKEVDPGYRCWVEYYLPGYGWVCADIVEADAPDGLGPKRWFTGLTERRVWLNEGREFLLNPRPAGGRVNTMSIGYAEIDGKAARVLPEGELKPQLKRSVAFDELASPMDPNTAAGMAPVVAAGSPQSTPATGSSETNAAGTSAGLTAAAQVGGSTAASVADSIWNRLSFFADGRLRAESTFDDPSGDDRHRGRLRWRVGGLYDLTEDIQAQARLSTASANDDSNNPHWDFGDGSDGFNGSNVVLDRFFLTWVPRSVPREALDVRAGKQPHVFTAPPVFGELVWDSDVHPAGLAAIWTQRGEGSAPSLDVRSAYYVAVENAGDTDPSMFGLQGNLTLPVAERTTVRGAVSYSHWGSLNSGVGVLGNQGNTSVAGDFDILEAWGSATFEGGPLGRTTGFLQLIRNASDDDDEENGVALGAILGKSGKEGDVNVFASLYSLDANAVFSPVAQDDTPIGGTGAGEGMQGVILGAQYFLADDFGVKLWILTSNADGIEDAWRARLDLDFKVH